MNGRTILVSIVCFLTLSFPLRSQNDVSVTDSSSFDIRTITPDTDINFYPTMAYDPEGKHLYLVYERIQEKDRQLMFMHCQKRTEEPKWWNWSGPQTIFSSMENVQFQSSPTFYKQNGNINLYFVAGDRSKYAIYRSSLQQNRTWTEAKKIQSNLDASYLQSPSVTSYADRSSGDTKSGSSRNLHENRTSERKIMLVFHTENNRIYMRTSEDGDTWSEASFVTEGRSPRVVSHNARQIMTFQRKEGGSYRGYYMKRSARSWRKPKSIDQKHANHSLYPFYHPEHNAFYALFLRVVGQDSKHENIFLKNLSSSDTNMKRLTDWTLKESQPRWIFPGNLSGKNDNKGQAYIYWSRRHMSRDFDIVIARWK